MLRKMEDGKGAVCDAGELTELINTKRQKQSLRQDDFKDDSHPITIPSAERNEWLNLFENVCTLISFLTLQT